MLSPRKQRDFTGTCLGPFATNKIVYCLETFSWMAETLLWTAPVLNHCATL